MSKKKKMIGRLEKEIERLRGELDRVDKEAKKRIKKAEKDAAALRDEVLRLIGQARSGGKTATDEKAGAAPDKPDTAIVEETPASPAVEAPAVTPTKVPDAPERAARTRAPAQKKPAKSAASGGPTVAQLRTEAKSKGIKGYSTMTKAQLLDALG